MASKCTGGAGGGASRHLVLLALLMALSCCIASPAPAPPPAVGIIPRSTRPPALILFGDSIVDSGNNNGLTTSMVRCNFAPYGQDFPPGNNATGRFSNGKIVGDILATRMGLKQHVPAYLGTELSDWDLLTGVSFASGGCGFDPLTSEIASVLSMDNQLDMFKEYKGKLKSIAGAQRAAYIVSTSLYLVVTGSDDLANTYFTTPFRRDYDLESYIQYIVQCATDFIKKLYGMGARRLSIAGAPPLGCMPSQRTLAGGHDRGCVSLYNQASVLYNAALEKEIKLLNGSAELPGSVLKYIDLYTPLLDMMQRPAAYGFEVADLGCCGTGLFEVTLTCNSYTADACADPTKFLFWDTYHLTETGYNILMAKIIDRYGLW
uniref:Uncharacterized protein n=1 Tax=Avena sativa TaxID=4498 RepID=A0ACD5W7J9_AVESA